MSDLTHYQVLGVPPGTPLPEIAARYRDLLRIADPEKIKDQTAAWDVIRDPARRAAYDKALRFQRMPCPHCGGTGRVMYRFADRDIVPAHCRKCNGVGFEPPIKKGSI